MGAGVSVAGISPTPSVGIGVLDGRGVSVRSSAGGNVLVIVGCGVSVAADCCARQVVYKTS